MKNKYNGRNGNGCQPLPPEPPTGPPARLVRDTPSLGVLPILFIAVMFFFLIFAK